jgi:cytochrome c-type biogenesis protein CcmH/NrfF
VAVSLLIGTEKGMFACDADERRRDWCLRGPMHRGWQVNALWVDCRSGRPVIWAGLVSKFYGPSLQRSLDCGQTWEPVAGPSFPDGSTRRLWQVWDFAAGPEPGSLIAGVAEAALFTSRDDGATWTMNDALETHETRDLWAPSAGNLALHSIVAHPAMPERMYVGVSAVGVFRTDDGGRTWRIKNDGVRAANEEEVRKYTTCMRCAHKVIQDPIEPDRLYQQNHTGVYRSLDAGDSWERVEDGLPARFGFPIVMHPRRRRTLFVVPLESDECRHFPDGHPGVYRSEDAGDHWVRTHRGIAEPNFGAVLRSSMVMDRHDEPGLYFGTTNGEVYASLDEGESWSRLPGALNRVTSLAVMER